jgi:hypothetical protein
VLAIPTTGFFEAAFLFQRHEAASFVAGARPSAAAQLAGTLSRPADPSPHRVQARCQPRSRSSPSRDSRASPRIRDDRRALSLLTPAITGWSGAALVICLPSCATRSRCCCSRRCRRRDHGRHQFDSRCCNSSSARRGPRRAAGSHIAAVFIAQLAFGGGRRAAAAAGAAPRSCAAQVRADPPLVRGGRRWRAATSAPSRPAESPITAARRKEGGPGWRPPWMSQ